MAPTIAGCCPMLQSAEEGGSGRRRLSLDSWVCLPILRPVRTVPASSVSSSLSSTGSSCATQQLHQEKATQQDLALPVKALDGEDEARVETGCETPKSKEHRIPDVDVGFCPPAPRKPRAMARRRRVQPTSFFNSPDFENFLAQHKVQVGS